jgi:arylsulfatase A-like enzyme
VTKTKQSKDIAHIAVWCAVVFGLIAGTMYEMLSFYERPASILGLSATNAHIIWIEPAFDVLLYLLLVPAVMVSARVLRLARRELYAFGFFSFVSFLGWLLVPARLHRVAALILAAGLAVCLCRWLEPRVEKATRFVRRTAPYLLGVPLLAGLMIYGAGYWGEASAAKKLPAATAKSNVLLIVLDTLRADHMSVYGYSRPTTPQLEKYAAEGTLFENAIAPSSWTLPSHATLFTGLYTYQHQANGERLHQRFLTLASALKSQGYYTAGFVGNTSYAHAKTGLANGFIHYADLFSSVADAAVRTVYGRRTFPRAARAAGYYDELGRKRAEDLNHEFLEWLDAPAGIPASDLGHARPFFAFLNYFDMHTPYLPPPAYAAKFSRSVDRIVKRKPVTENTFPARPESAEDAAAEKDAYDASIAYLDEELGKLFSELKQRGLLEHTLVVITSDHGEAIFEHETFGHSLNLYREAIHVPLILVWPRRVPVGVRDSRMANLADLPRTIFELLGLESPFAGHSLIPSANDPKGAEWMAFSDLLFWGHSAHTVSFVNQRWHWLRYPDGRMELFDWQSDKQEVRDVSQLEANRGVVQMFEEALRAAGGKVEVSTK